MNYITMPPRIFLLLFFAMVVSTTEIAAQEIDNCSKYNYLRLKDGGSSNGVNTVFVVWDYPPTQLLGLNTGINIQPSPTTILQSSIATLNPTLAGAGYIYNLSSSGGNVVGFAPFGPPINISNLPLATKMFTIQFIGEPSECYTISLQAANYLVPPIDPMNPNVPCPFKIGPDLEVCIGSYTFEGIVESIPPLQCQGTINSGIYEAEVNIIEAGVGSSASFTCQTETNTSGEYECTVLPNLTYSISVEKETGFDCGLTFLDAHMITQAWLNPFTNPLTTWQAIAADANGNYNISTLDAVTVQKISLGIPLSSQVNYKPWFFIPTLDYVIYPPLQGIGIWQSAFPFSEEAIRYAPSAHATTEFIGIKVGDMDASCTACESLWNADDRSVGKKLGTVEIPKVEVGEEVWLNFNLSEPENFQAYNMDLEFNTDYFEILEVQSKTTEGSFLHRIPEEIPNLLRLSWLSFTNEETEINNLVAVKVRILQNIQPTDGLVKLVNENIIIGQSTEEIYQLSLEVKASNAEISMEIVPNPFTNNGYVMLNTETEEIAQVLIFNQMGQQVYVDKVALNVGENSYQLPDNLATGIYFCQIKGTTIDLAKRFSVI